MDIFDDQTTSQRNKMVYKSNMQVYACSYDGYMNKLYLSTIHNIKKRSKRLNINITVQDIKDLYQKQEGKCAISGKHMTCFGYTQTNDDKHNINKWNTSIDRIDSKKGYNKENIQLICGIGNRMKTDMNTNQLLLLCNDVNKTNFDKINRLIINEVKK